MEPGLGDKQYLIFKKYFHSVPNPKRGEIILYHDPKSETVFVGRVIILPSEEFTISNGSIYIKNGEISKLDEPYLKPGFKYQTDVTGFWSELGQAQYIILPDNRNDQMMDFKKHMIEQSDIVGILMNGFWYPKKCLSNYCPDDF